MVSAVIFVFCAYYIINYFQWNVIFQLLLRIDWKWMPIAVSFMILLFWLFRAMRWHVLLKASGIHIGFFRLYMVGAISVAFAILTPLQSGEALKVELLKKTGSLERVPGYGIFMTERILDLMVVLLIAVFSILFGVSKFLDKSAVFAIMTLILMVCIAFFMMIQRVSPTGAWGRFFQPFNQCVRSGRLLSSVIAFTIAGWFFVALGWYAGLRSVSVDISILETTAMMTITTLIGIFSLIPWSLGISEVSISSFLVYFKQEVPFAQAGALVIRLYGIVTLVLGFLHFIIWKYLDFDQKNN
jgi:uncharacterized membrane protein YbhN (UPF0104 family)